MNQLINHVLNQVIKHSINAFIIAKTAGLPLLAVLRGRLAATPAGQGIRDVRANLLVLQEGLHLVPKPAVRAVRVLRLGLVPPVLEVELVLGLVLQHHELCLQRLWHRRATWCHPRLDVFHCLRGLHGLHRRLATLAFLGLLRLAVLAFQGLRQLLVLVGGRG